jgi:GNAT superfamily N-acetyltransferase
MIRPLNPDADGPGIVDLIHEVFPFGTTTVESWRQQLAGIPPRARHAGWVAIVDREVVGRAEASLNWFSTSNTAFAGVSVREAFRRRGIGSRLWELAESHLHELAPSRVLSNFVETPEGVSFARARGFEEARAEALSCVDPRAVDASPLEAAPVELVPFHDIAPEEIYEVDMITTPDVPMTDRLDDIRYDDWLNLIWRRPTITLDGSFAAVKDSLVLCITMLAANLEKRRAFNEYTGTLPTHRGRGLAELVKRASLRWAAASGITAVWTTNDETNAPMLAVNRRLGYVPKLRRMEYVREAERAS